METFQDLLDITRRMVGKNRAVPLLEWAEVAARCNLHPPRLIAAAETITDILPLLPQAPFVLKPRGYSFGCYYLISRSDSARGYWCERLKRWIRSAELEHATQSEANNRASRAGWIVQAYVPDSTLQFSMTPKARFYCFGAHIEAVMLEHRSESKITRIVFNTDGSQIGSPDSPTAPVDFNAVAPVIERVSRVAHAQNCDFAAIDVLLGGTGVFFLRATSVPGDVRYLPTELEPDFCFSLMVRTSFAEPTNGRVAARRLDDTTARKLLSIAEKLRNGGNRRAEQFLAAGLERFVHPVLLRALAGLQRERGDIDAVTSLARSTVESTRHPEMLRAIFDVLLAAEQFSEVEKVCAFLKKDGVSARRYPRWFVATLSALPHMAKGGACWREGALNEAASAYKRALKANPRNRKVLRLLSRVQFARGDYAQALSCSRRIDRQFAASVDELRELFRALRALRPEAAERWIRRVKSVASRPDIGEHRAVRAARVLAAANETHAAAHRLQLLPEHDWPSDLALHYFNFCRRRCDFRNAFEFLQGRPAMASASRAEVRRDVEVGLSLAEAWGLPAGGDFRSVALEKLKQATERHRLRYRPKQRHLVACVERTTFGELQRQAHSICEFLARKQCEANVSLLSMEGDENSTSFWGTPAYDLHYLAEFEQEDIGLDREVYDIARVIGLPQLTSLLAAIWHMQPDAVHNFYQTNVASLLASLLIGVPRVVTRVAGMHSSDFKPGDDPQIELSNLIYRMAAEHEGVVLSANSRGTAANWAAQTSIPVERFSVVYNGFEPAQLGKGCYDVRRFRLSLGIPPEAFVIGGVFRISDEKDPMLWVDVARTVLNRVANAHFLVVGDGPMTGRLRERVDSLEMMAKFTFAGAVRDNILAYYQCMNVLLLTSRREGFGNVIVEAQFAGVPVVSTDVGGVAEALATEQTGTLIKDRSPASLAAAVLDYLNSPDARSTVAAIAPDTILRRFSTPATVEAYVRAYNWTVDGSCDVASGASTAG